jgi:drug/metabolite transporter (DMT)-like permease
MGKGRTPSLAFFAAAEGTMGLVGLVAWPWSLPALAGVPTRFWWLLALSCACQAAYYAGLAAAYRRNDLSAAYPLVRALPVALLTAGAGCLGWRPLSEPAVMGVILVVLGCLCVPMTSWSGWRTVLAGLGQPSILAAAAFSAVYTGIDAGLTTMAMAVNGMSGVLALASVMAVGNGIGCTVLALLLAGERRHLAIDRAILPRAMLAGSGIWLSYGTALLALPLVGNPGYVTAFRQLSIPLGVVLGMLVLHERPSPQRQSGVAVIVAGLVLLALAPR